MNDHDWELPYKVSRNTRCFRCDIKYLDVDRLASINYLEKLCLGNRNIPGQSDPNFINIYYPCISDEEYIIKNIIK